MSDNTAKSYWLAKSSTADLAQEFKVNEMYVARSLGTIAGDYDNMSDEDVIETFRNDETTLAKQEAEAHKHMKYISVRTNRPEQVEAFLYPTAKIVGKQHEDLGMAVLVVEVDGLFGTAVYQSDRLNSAGNIGAKPHDSLEELKAWGAENGVPDIADGLAANEQ